MTCCGSCDSKKKSSSDEMDWGPQGFKIMNDDTFIVPAESEFAGWKDGYKQGWGCECKSSYGDRRSGDLIGASNRQVQADAAGLAADSLVEATLQAEWDEVLLDRDDEHQNSTKTHPIRPHATLDAPSPDGSFCVEAAGQCCVSLYCDQVGVGGFAHATHCRILIEDCSGGSSWLELSPMFLVKGGGMRGPESMISMFDASDEPMPVVPPDARMCESCQMCSEEPTSQLCSCVVERALAYPAWRFPGKVIDAMRAGKIGVLSLPKYVPYDGLRVNSNAFAGTVCRECGLEVPGGNILPGLGGLDYRAVPGLDTPLDIIESVAERADANFEEDWPTWDIGGGGK